MQIPNENLEEFRRIYKEAMGEEISLSEAREMVQRLLTLYQVVGRQLPGSDQPPEGESGG